MFRSRRGGSASVARMPLACSTVAGRGRFGVVGVLSLGAAVLALAVLVGLTLTGNSANAAFPGTNGKIACQGSLNRAGSNPAGGTTFGIFTINPDGSQFTQLTNNGGAPAGQQDPDDLAPNYSPDGKKIVFDSVRSGGDDIYTMNADGTDVRRLTFAIGADGAAHWSPDGRQIVFSSARVQDQFDVYRMNADGSAQTRLTFNPLNDGRASWSPDGTRIAFETTRKSATDPAEGPFNGEIATMNPDGSDVTVLTDTKSPVSHRSTRWSPDSRQIAFESNRAEPGPPTTASNTDIYKMNRDGSGVTRLTTNAGTPGIAGSANDNLPQFSPDGTKIVFDSGRNRESVPAGTAQPNPTEVYTMNADGSGQTRITNSPGTDSRCDWQPIPRPAATPPVYPTPPFSYPRPPVTPPVAGKLRTSLTLKARPRRDRRPPFRFAFSGRVRVPSGANRASVCGGRVRLVVKKRRRTVARGTARVSRRCTYRKRITIRSTRRTGRRKARLRVNARFGGNAALKASKRSTTVRIF